ncbi:WD40 repeat-like protein [Hesseltinella vesiculosa]|uniref:WD40 repeat-like protein n=1 Tax=Hesseltinella vesiculosa TaxID=101127 RepID=A0A1X2GQS5_9FUNG|nr:WD40 repeat-like protein [Hesseltinella vesiculosa]
MPKDDNKSGNKRSSTAAAPFPSSSEVMSSARDTAIGLASTAREWLQPNWSAPAVHLESLATVMFSPLAAHPVYRSESMVKAIQLAQQQRQRSPSTGGQSSPKSPSCATDLVLHWDSQPWPSSATLLSADIPEPAPGLSLFQSFATTYPSLTDPSTNASPKRSRNRRKKNAVPLGKAADGALKGIIEEREKKIRESDKINMHMTSISNEIRQIDMQIDDLINKRKSLEERWAKLETKGQQTQLSIEELTEKIMADQDDASSSSKPAESIQEESDDEYGFGETFKTLSGHEASILCVDFSHKKGTLVSSSLDHTVRVWDLRRGICSGQLDGHTNVVRCLQLDDMRLLTGSDDGLIKQWDISALSQAPTPISMESFSNFSSAQASPSSSPVVRAQDAPPPNYCISTLDGHQAEVTAMHADATHLVSGSNDKTMRLWDLETQTCVLTMDVMWASQHSSPTNHFSLESLKINLFEHASNYIGDLQFWNFALASGTVDGKIRMWDLRTGQVHRTLPGHKGAVTCLQFDEIHLVTGSVDKTIRVWDLRTGSVFDTLNFNHPINSLGFDTGKIICSDNSNNIDLYNRTSFHHSKLEGHTAPVQTLQYKNNVLASGGHDNVVKLWSL